MKIIYTRKESPNGMLVGVYFTPGKSYEVQLTERSLNLLKSLKYQESYKIIGDNGRVCYITHQMMREGVFVLLEEHRENQINKILE